MFDNFYDEVLDLFRREELREQSPDQTRCIAQPTQFTNTLEPKAFPNLPQRIQPAALNRGLLLGEVESLVVQLVHNAGPSVERTTIGAAK